LFCVLIRLENLRTLDLSKNNLTILPAKSGNLKNLKSLNLEQNQLTPGTLDAIAYMVKLQNLSVGGNLLGRPTAVSAQKHTFPALPVGLKQLKLDSNFFSSVPRTVVSAQLTKLEKLDLSKNQLAAVPAEISNLKQLMELNLDDNVIVSLPDTVGELKNLKQLSLRNNHISVHSTTFSDTNPQPLPALLFTDTPLIDLNLHGNPMTNTQLNMMEGYDTFLDRRQKVKKTAITGGALTDLDVCGLE
jgi:Leucine-rich repeat (LRR) protein